MPYCVYSKIVNADHFLKNSWDTSFCYLFVVSIMTVGVKCRIGCSNEIFLCIGLNVAGLEYRYRLGLGFKTWWLHCAMQNIFTLHTLGTRIPISESVSVPEFESGNVIKPYYCHKFCLPVDKSGFTLDDCCAIYFMYLLMLIIVTYSISCISEHG